MRAINVLKKDIDIIDIDKFIIFITIIFFLDEYLDNDDFDIYQIKEAYNFKSISILLSIRDLFPDNTLFSTIGHKICQLQEFQYDKDNKISCLFIKRFSKFITGNKKNISLYKKMEDFFGCFEYLQSYKLKVFIIYINTRVKNDNFDDFINYLKQTHHKKTKRTNNKLPFHI